MPKQSVWMQDYGNYARTCGACGDSSRRCRFVVQCFFVRNCCSIWYFSYWHEKESWFLSHCPRATKGQSGQGFYLCWASCRCVCGKGYTSLSWFLGVQNPSKPACRHVEQHCVADAVLLDGGHTRSLANTPYAKKQNQKPKPLLGDLRRLSVARFVQTEIAGLKVKRCDGTLEGRRKSQILWSQGSLWKAWEHF